MSVKKHDQIDFWAVEKEGNAWYNKYEIKMLISRLSILQMICL